MQILLDLALLVPRNGQDPVEIVAHDGGFGRHRRHLPQLLEFGRRFVARLLRELGLLDALLEFGEVVLAVLVAELLLDRLHLLVEIILALRLLHLALDARADALLHLQDGDFAFHQGETFLQPLADGVRLQDRLLVENLDGEMRSHRIGELGIVLDLIDRGHDLGRDLLVELHIALEFGHDGARQSLDLDLIGRLVGNGIGIGLVEIVRPRIAMDARPHLPFDEHLHRAVGQFQKLQHRRERAGLENRIRARVVIGGIDLGGKQDQLVAFHHLFEGANGLLAADEKRHDHVRENDDIAERQNRVALDRSGRNRLTFLAGHIYFLFLQRVPEFS